MTKPGVERGRKLTLADKRQIRAEVVAMARQTGARAFTIRYDGDTKFEFRAWPDGRCVKQKLSAERDLSVAPATRIILTGVEARVVGVAVVVLAIVGEVLSRVL